MGAVEGGEQGQGCQVAEQTTLCCPHFSVHALPPWLSRQECGLGQCQPCCSLPPPSRAPVQRRTSSHWVTPQLPRWQSCPCRQVVAKPWCCGQCLWGTDGLSHTAHGAACPYMASRCTALAQGCRRAKRCLWGQLSLRGHSGGAAAGSAGAGSSPAAHARAQAGASRATACGAAWHSPVSLCSPLGSGSFCLSRSRLRLCTLGKFPPSSGSAPQPSLPLCCH